MELSFTFDPLARLNRRWPNHHTSATQVRVALNNIAAKQSTSYNFYAASSLPVRLSHQHTIHNNIAFRTNNFMQRNSFTLPDWLFDSSLTPQQQQQQHQRQGVEDLQAQNQQHDVLMRYQQQLRHQQQRRIPDFPGKHQTGGGQQSQTGGSKQFNQRQQQHSARMSARTPQSGGIQKPPFGDTRIVWSQISFAERARAEARLRNEIAERALLEFQERQAREEHVRRRAELKKDPSANYRHYKEYLEYFPLERGERANDYLLGLLANQEMPPEPTSDMGLAVQYARRHWENSWTMEDLEYVLGRAKEEIERKEQGPGGRR